MINDDEYKKNHNFKKNILIAKDIDNIVDIQKPKQHE